MKGTELRKATPGSVPPIIVKTTYSHVCILPARVKPPPAKTAAPPPNQKPEPTMEQKVADEVERRLRDRGGNFILGSILGEWRREW
jgi:hypothetical protein